MAQPSASVVQIIRSTRDRLPRLLDRIAARVRAEVPFYATEDIVGAEELRRSLRANVEYVLGGLLGGDVADTAAPTATGRARAEQGVPLVEMLAAYRLGFAEVWGEMVDVARTLPEVTDAALVELAGEIFALHSRYADASVSGYRDEYGETVRTTQREHSALVEAVLAGSTTKGALWEVAQALRLPMEGHFLVVAAEALELGHDPLSRVEPALSALDVSSVWRLQPAQSVGVLFCHPNTVRYRLRRIEEVTCRSLSAPTQLAELATAVRAWSELPHQG